MSEIKLKLLKRLFAIISISFLITALGVEDRGKVKSAPIVATKVLEGIAVGSASYAAEPELPGAKYYYCDCGTGSQPDCVAGNDANSGTNKSAPRRSIGNAAARFSSLVANDSVALCKGGAFNVNPATTLNIGSSRCGAGVTCNALREYTPTTFVGTAKPIINKPQGVDQLFRFAGNTGGVRILNLSLNGKNGSPSNMQNNGFFFYKGAHDVTLGNLDLDGFSIAVYNESGEVVKGVPAVNSKIKISGSRITNSSVMGYLGSGNDVEISYNFWEGNGSSNDRDHTIYLSAHNPVTGIKVTGNYVRGQYGPVCNGAPIVGHGGFDHLEIKDNVVDIDPVATRAACWGIAFGHGGYAQSNYLRHAIFSGNILVNTGNTALIVSGCPDCIIENNLIMQDWSYTPGWTVIGIAVAQDKARPIDDVNNRNLIRNNTVWFGPNTIGGAVGIKVGTEGTGHKVSNNSVVYSSTKAGQGVRCFEYPLAHGSYGLINNNHCYSSTSVYSWEAKQGTLLAWKAASGFDTSSLSGVDPQFKNVATVVSSDFTLRNNSPLIGKGNNINKSVHDIKGNTRVATPSIGAYEY